MDAFKQWKLEGLTEVEKVLEALHNTMKRQDLDVSFSYYDVVKAEAFIKTLKDNL
jgi:hypothetical protein